MAALRAWEHACRYVHLGLRALPKWMPDQKPHALFLLLLVPCLTRLVGPCSMDSVGLGPFAHSALHAMV